MIKHRFIMLLLLPFLLGGCENNDGSKLPNILLIYADDLGYGDISCYNPESKVETPNIDYLAEHGIMFTDVHSASTVCTPSRYSILTGRMAFRTGLRGVLGSISGPCLRCSVKADNFINLKQKICDQK